jgi:hypothetical protein
MLDQIDRDGDAMAADLDLRPRLQQGLSPSETVAATSKSRDSMRGFQNSIAE